MNKQKMESLSDMIEMFDKAEHIVKAIPTKKVKESLRKRNALIKDRIVKNDIYTADELFRLEDEVDEEVFGKELVE